ncbi:LysM peptidoglycan-binding domain-containing protein [Actinokineospora iranica]|uniref:LysM domain-containing protein n=1 Tax=Actinokineospora iranica TaxID=1271860 RepID=A0A1G6LU41_9PSEU|nr:LysM peptidoglycan-binding domain-containing protein [Actinokineospora iranica]SDC46818.1 hypothetical protein SAMN05216174_102244 [Actinokineospora iranica]
MAAVLASESAELAAGRSSHVAALARPILRPVRREGQGRLRPPTRGRAANAAHVVAAPDCAPRLAPLSVAALVAIAVVVAAAVYGLGLFAGAMTGGAEVPPTTTVVRVGPGESLSEVAERMAPGSDVAAVVERIRELNSLDGGAVRVGQPLTVPFSR